MLRSSRLEHISVDRRETLDHGIPADTPEEKGRACEILRGMIWIE